jgi:AraC-like DNA-binding protein
MYTKWVAPRHRRVTKSPAPPLAQPPPLQSLLGPAVNWQALLTPVVANSFDQLSISVALWITGDWWYPIHTMPSVLDVEYEHAVASRRWAYNRRCFEQVRQTRKILHAQHAGFSDLFVPVQDKTRVRGILVAGPFSTARPTGTDVVQRWYELTGSHARPAEPDFSRYLDLTLSTLTLEGPLFDAFKRLMSCFAGLVVRQGNPDALAAEAEAMRVELQESRFAERMWDTARELVDERTSRHWGTHSHSKMTALGIQQIPQHVVVGLLPGRPDEPDGVGDLLRRDAFLRACVGLARKWGGVVCGRIGDHGVVFLVDHAGSGARSKLGDLAARAASTARRFGLELYAGISRATTSEPIPTRYHSALWAAEKALSRGERVVYGEPRPERLAEHLRQLRSELGRSIQDRPGKLSPRFDRYIEAVLAHAGYRLEPTRAHLEAGLERLAEPLRAGGLIDQKSYDDLSTSMERTAEEARTVMELVGSYRRLVSDIEAAMQGPTAARTDRGTRRALAFMREHAGERLSLARVARVAGFAPDYFSRLFKKSEGMTFGRYLQELRVERAKQMLSGTTLTVEQVQRLSGFQNRPYFHRLFKNAVGMTPIAYRERAS